MHQKLLKSAHYIELGSYQYWPVLVPRGIRLYTYEQIPVSLKDNPYITDGYRAYLPSRLCIKRYGVAAAAGDAGALPPPRTFCRGSLRRPQPGVPTCAVPPIPSPTTRFSLPVVFPRRCSAHGVRVTVSRLRRRPAVCPAASAAPAAFAAAGSPRWEPPAADGRWSLPSAHPSLVYF